MRRDANPVLARARTEIRALARADQSARMEASVTSGWRPWSSAVTSPAIGSLIGGKYRVVSVLGEGGAGLVVAAEHASLGHLVAIKVLKNAGARARCQREATAAARIQSEHVVRVQDIGELEDGTPFIVMEHVDGVDLGAMIAHGGPLPIRTAIACAIDVSRALADVHAAGLVHRDLKPANVLLARRRDGALGVKLADFGLSTLVTERAHDREVTGSPGYMAPEQIRGEDVDARADIWAAGGVLYESLTARRAFDAPTIPQLFERVLRAAPVPARALRSDVPAALDAVIARCLEKDRARRFEDVRALEVALGAL